MLWPNYKNFQKGKVVKGNIKGKRKGGEGGQCQWQWLLTSEQCSKINDLRPLSTTFMPLLTLTCLSSQVAAESSHHPAPIILKFQIISIHSFIISWWWYPGESLENLANPHTSFQRPRPLQPCQVIDGLHLDGIDNGFVLIILMGLIVSGSGWS